MVSFWIFPLEKLQLLLEALCFAQRQFCAPINRFVLHCGLWQTPFCFPVCLRWDVTLQIASSPGQLFSFYLVIIQWDPHQPQLLLFFLISRYMTSKLNWTVIHSWIICSASSHCCSGDVSCVLKQGFHLVSFILNSQDTFPVFYCDTDQCGVKGYCAHISLWVVFQLRWEFCWCSGAERNETKTPELKNLPAGWHETVETDSTLKTNSWI